MTTKHHYIGPYAMVKTNKSHAVNMHRTECDEGHVIETKFIYFALDKVQYCPTCGKPVSIRNFLFHEYPTNIFDILDVHLSEDVADITPSSCEEGTLIIRSNRNDFGWEIDDQSGPDMITLPSEIDVSHMLSDFRSALYEVLEVLKDLEIVESVTVQFGYVRTEER